MRPPLRLLFALSLFVVAVPASAAKACDWPHWQRFQRDYISADGRVIDQGSARAVTVSEGQAYALFFALVANDRASFDRLLRWTEDNLAAGDLTRRLPAWQWGRADDGTWGVLDSNSASDSDLWIAYTLSQAARLWKVRRYRVLAGLVGRNLMKAAVTEIPGLGPTLLPAPIGFALKQQQWRLNPSYAPPQLLRGLTVAQPDAGWDTLLPSNLRLLLESAPRGFAPDWALYDAASGRFLPDERSRALGSYDAIRVYLWIGSLHPDDPDRPALLRAYQAMAQHTATAGAPPEEVDIGTGVVRNNGPAGFSAALLPFLRSAGLAEAARTQRERLRDARPEDQAERYYDNVLSLFGRGWDEGRYRYGADGSLATRWSRPACKPLP